MSSGLVREYYVKNAVKEWKRLVRDPFHRLEFGTTMLFLRKYLPKKGLILDAGGGPGRYTIELARLGYDMVLLDFVPELLQIAKFGGNPTQELAQTQASSKLVSIS